MLVYRRVPQDADQLLVKARRPGGQHPTTENPAGTKDPGGFSFHQFGVDLKTKGLIWGYIYIFIYL